MLDGRSDGDGVRGEPEEALMAEAKRSFVLDENGNRTAVMLPIEEYEQLLEDLQDLAVIAQRRNEDRKSVV